jgi:predicted RNase H-like HicB family nuclease
MSELSVNISVREESMDNKKVFIINNEETGVADFGDTLEQAIDNFRKSLRLYLETYPEKRKLLINEEKSPVFVSRILL